MAIRGTALGQDQVVPAIFLVKVRAFSETEIGALEDLIYRANKPVLIREVFLYQNASEARASLAVIGFHARDRSRDCEGKLVPTKGLQ